jgi:hypothetical protein
MYIYKYMYLLRMTDTMTSQNIGLPCWDTLYSSKYVEETATHSRYLRCCGLIGWANEFRIVKQIPLTRCDYTFLANFVEKSLFW